MMMQGGAMPPRGGAPPQGSPNGYVVCMVPVSYMQGQQGQAPGAQPGVGMPQESTPDQGMQQGMMQQWAVPMQQQGAAAPQGDEHNSRGRANPNQMGGHSFNQMQMMQGAPQGMMWQPQQYQQQWGQQQRLAQQEQQAAQSASAGESSWNTAVAEFVPQAQRRAPVASFDVAAKPFVMPSTPQSFENPIAHNNPPQMAQQVPDGAAKKKGGMLKNARIDKTGCAVEVPGTAGEGDEACIALQPSATGQPPVLAAQEKAATIANRKMPGSKQSDGHSTISALGLESPYTTGQKPAPSMKPISTANEDMRPEAEIATQAQQNWGGQQGWQGNNMAAQRQSGWGMQKGSQRGNWGQQQQQQQQQQQPGNQQQEQQAQRNNWGAQQPAQQAGPPPRDFSALKSQPKQQFQRQQPPPVKVEEPKKVEEEVKVTAAEFPTLGMAAKPKKGATAKKVAKADEETPAPEPEPEVPKVAEKVLGAAWGKGGQEARAKAAKEADAAAKVAAEAAAAKAAADAEQEANAAKEVAETVKAEEALKAAEIAEAAEKARATEAAEKAKVAAAAQAAEKARAAEVAEKEAAEKAKAAAVAEKARIATELAEKAKAEAAEKARAEAAEKAAEKAKAEAAEKAKADAAEKALAAEAAEEARVAAEAAEKAKVAQAAEKAKAAEAAEKAVEKAKTEEAAEKAKAEQKLRDEVEDDVDTKDGDQVEETEDDDDEVDESLEKRCKCGNEFMEDSMFCRMCGTKRQTAAEAVAEPAASESPANSASENEAGQVGPGRNAVFRDFFAFRALGCEQPEEIATLAGRQHDSAWRETAEGDRPQRDDRAGEQPSDRALFGQNSKASNRDGGDRRDRDRDRRGDRGGRDRDRDRGGRSQFERGPREAQVTIADMGGKAENAYKRADPKVALGRDAELRKNSISLLNKICPENVSTIAKRIKEELHVVEITEMELVIGLIFKKALAEPHYCETYATMVFMLKGEMPAFPNPAGGKDITFKTILLNVCQAEFEAMPRSLDVPEEDTKDIDPAELEFKRKTQKARFLANMKFIGHLFLQQLLTTKIVAGIVSELVGSASGDMVPEEHVVECICELLTAIGYTLEGMPAGKECVGQVCCRLLDLKVSKKKDGKGLLSNRIRFAIQDVLDMRAAGWTKKTFKNVAKTKEEIKLEQEKDIQNAARGKTTVAEYVVAGARPSFVQKDAAGASGSKQDDDWTEAKTGKNRR